MAKDITVASGDKDVTKTVQAGGGGTTFSKAGAKPSAPAKDFLAGDVAGAAAAPKKFWHAGSRRWVYPEDSDYKKLSGEKAAAAKNVTGTKSVVGGSR